MMSCNSSQVIIAAHNCHNCLNTFQVASFAKWIKCTQKHAVKGKLTQKNVDRACDDGKNDEPFPPKCDQKIFFFNGKNEKC